MYLLNSFDLCIFLENNVVQYNLVCIAEKIESTILKKFTIVRFVLVLYECLRMTIWGSYCRNYIIIIYLRLVLELNGVIVKNWNPSKLNMSFSLLVRSARRKNHSKWIAQGVCSFRLFLPYHKDKAKRLARNRLLVGPTMNTQLIDDFSSEITDINKNNKKQKASNKEFCTTIEPNSK